MKLVFDGKGLIKGHKYSNVIAIPTTAKEKYFFSECKRDNGSDYKLWVYKKLYELDNLVIDNQIADGFGDDYVSMPKPSNICILSLYYTLSKKFRKARRVKLLYEKSTEMFLNQSVVTIKEKENVK